MKISIIGTATQFTKDATSFHGAKINRKTVIGEDKKEEVVNAIAHINIAGAAHVVNEGDWLVEFPHTVKEIWPDAKFKKLAICEDEEEVAGPTPAENTPAAEIAPAVGLVPVETAPAAETAPAEIAPAEIAPAETDNKTE